MSDEPKPRIKLERSDRKGWRVTLGPKVEFTGNRVTAKRVARQLCLREGHRSWWNQKKGGEWVEVPL